MKKLVLLAMVLGLLVSGCVWDVVVVPPSPYNPYYSGYYYYWYPDYPHGCYGYGGYSGHYGGRWHRR